RSALRPYGDGGPGAALQLRRHLGAGVAVVDLAVPQLLDGDGAGLRLPLVLEGDLELVLVDAEVLGGLDEAEVVEVGELLVELGLLARGHLAGAPREDDDGLVEVARLAGELGDVEGLDAGVGHGSEARGRRGKIVQTSPD